MMGFMKTNLRDLAAKLRTEGPTITSVPKKDIHLDESDNLLFLGTFADREYIPALRGMFGGINSVVCTQPVELLTHLDIYCDKWKVNKVVTTNTEILKKLVSLRGEVSNPKLGDYAGSFFEYNGKEIVFIDPPVQCYSVPYGKFLTNRYISKLVSADKWAEPTKFNYTLLTPANIEEWHEKFQSAFFIATDIETVKAGLRIRCVSYTGVFINDAAIGTQSVVLPLEDHWSLAWMKKFNLLDPDKVFQNGRYDNAYFLRYGSIPKNWLWDTATMSHCLYSELPKDLGFQNAFWLRKVVYWKDLAETTDLDTYYRYNALDSWATANVAIQWFLQAPDWAKKNYFLEFPLNFPCLLAEMTGVLRDQSRLEEVRGIYDAKIEKELISLRTCINIPTFNPNSSPQVIKLMHILGDSKATSSDEKNLNNLKYSGPLAGFIVDKILDIRGWRKAAGTYARLGSDAKKDGSGGAKEYKGTWLYTQVPHGTDTGRLSSGEHHYWCGANIQNVPIRDGTEIKSTIISPPGFYIAESDLSKAETWDTAYIAGEENLIKAVNSPKDFHSLNASAMSGLDYDSIYNDHKQKTLNKKIRDLFKRVNHGATYNMGEGVLVDTMGLKMIWEAKKLLGLTFRKAKQIAGFLLERFHDTYPQIKKNPSSMYACIVNEVGITSRIVSRAYHHIKFNLLNFSVDEYIQEGDWTRYCFGDPTKNKLILNSYVAHPPQSLNARTLNEGFMEVFYQIALPCAKDFRLHAQIHDSILFSWRIGCTDLPPKVRKLMEIPVTVLGVDKVKRTFTVPADVKLGKKLWNGSDNVVVDDYGNEVIQYARYWSETE